MDNAVKDLFFNLSRRNISALYCVNKLSAINEVLSLIPIDANIGISGSRTLDELGVVGRLKLRGNRVFDQYSPGIGKEESLNLREQGISADYYLTSANAVSKEGEIVFLSAYGHRSAGVSNAKNLIVVCGINKITPDINSALTRAREYTAPLNCKRLNWNGACLGKGVCRKDICFFPEYKRMCCQTLIIEAEVNPGRLKFILVGESLGF